MPATPTLVAVSARRLPIGRIRSWLEPAVALPTYYTDAIHRAGGIAAVLAPQPPDRSDAAATLRRFDALVLTGGLDLDPAAYGQPPHAETKLVEPEVDAWERALLDAARATDLPVLAICRGAQLLNVARGGTLLQHLPDRFDERAHGIPFGGGGTANEIVLEPGSRVAAAFGATSVTGNCHHHQAVDRLGEGLVVTGRTADGVIEAIEDPSAAWLVAVQWHPEDSAMVDPVQQRLFDRFVGDAAALAERRALATPG